MIQLCILLLVVGIVFLLMEMWLPGVEFFAIIGLVALAVSAVLAIMFVPNGWLIVAGQGVVVALFLLHMYSYMRRKQLQGKLILSETLETPPVDDFSRYLGHEGKTVTFLRPSGEVDFNGTRVQASSNGPMIGKGAKVRVIETQQDRIIVRAVEGN